MNKSKNKKLFAGPFLGEFGWELFCWQGYIRHLSRSFDFTTVCCRKGHTGLYKDFADEIIEYNTEKDLHNLIVDKVPTVRILGDDYRKRTDYTGYGLCPEVYFVDRSHGWSTTKYKKLIAESLKEAKQ